MPETPSGEAAVRPSFDQVPAVFGALRRTLGEVFPALGDVKVTHTWGGPLGIGRDWCASAGLDRATGLGWAGGYVGDGLATTNLAGRTLADLILGTGSDLTRLPWVNHRSRPWESEPLRWLGMRAARAALGRCRRQSSATQRRARAARARARRGPGARSR